MDYDLVIIGSGPAGYVAAIRAGQVGLKTALVEKNKIGGMCLHWGCVPVKSLLESAKFYQRMVREAKYFGIDGLDTSGLSLNWPRARERSNKIVERLGKEIQALLDKNAVDVIQGDATLLSCDSVRVDNRRITTRVVFIATGSRPERKSLAVPDGLYIEIDDLLRLDSLPEHIVVVGETANALEIAQLLKLAGQTVTLISPALELLPGADPFLSKYGIAHLKKDGVHVNLGAEITGHFKSGIVVGGEKIRCDALINCHQRRAVLPKSEVKLELENGFVKVNECLQTNQPSVFAVGDVNGKMMLAHAASAQGIFATNFVTGIVGEMDFSHYPINIYSFPEMAQVGKTEPELQTMGIEYKVSEFPLSANAKALTEGAGEGLIRLLSEKKYGEVLGVQIIAAHATDLIAEATAIMQLEGTVFDVAKVVHAHPTVSEIFTEAGRAAIGSDNSE